MITDFNKKQKKEVSANKVAFQIAGVIFLVIIIVLVLADFKMYQKRKELVLQINNYKKEISDIEKSSQNLKDSMANANNQDYLEKIAYEQLGQQKPGEKEVIFINPEKKVDTVSNTDNFLTANSWSAWFSGVWHWIKNKF